MSSAGIAVTSKEFWKGTDLIEKKLKSDLDCKVVSSTKQALLGKIEFKEASRPDPFYQNLKKKYTPLNNDLNPQNNGNDPRQNVNKDKKKIEANGKVIKDGLPLPKHILFKKEKVHLQWRTVRKVGPGLFNLGNTCFLNSVIQVLTYTPPLVNYLATQEHSNICATVGFCMLCELQRHVLRTFLHHQNEAIKPMAILQKLKYIARHLRFGQQEDSHEFLRYVIDGMMKSCLTGIPEKLDAYSKATTMVHQVFGGYYRSQVTCEKCQHISSTYDPLMEVLLDIKHTHTVVHALRKLISVEVLSGENMYLCPRCKRKVPAKKSLRIHEPPNVMTMCLKRFDSHSLFASKINKEISYEEQLNLRPFMSKNQGPAVNYRLYAVLVHSGYSCNSGHYYCFIKAANGHWYQMNDASVRQVNLKTVLNQQAYLLFYIKDHNTTQKEQTNMRQKSTSQVWANGMKPEGVNSQKQHSPKIISDPPKKTPQFPKKPESSFFKASVQSKGQFNPVRPTSIPQSHEKITFAFSTGTQLKKTKSCIKEDDNKESDKFESLKVCKSENETNFEQNKTEQLQVNEISSSVEENKTQKLNSADEKRDKSETTCKGVVNETKSTDICPVHATTKWNVSKNLPPSPATSVLGSLPTGGRERTPSMSSEVSNPGSVASKTGEWSVCDQSVNQKKGLRMPERQHAGWMVSDNESSKKVKEPAEAGSSEQTTAENEESQSRKKSHKRKHSKEKHKKKKTKTPEDESKLLPEECREESEDDRKREKVKRLRKLERANKRKQKENSSDDDEEQKRKKKRKKKKAKHKRKRDSDERSSSKRERKTSERSADEIEEDGQNLNTSKEHFLPASKGEESCENFETKIRKNKDGRPNKSYDSDKVKSHKHQDESRDTSCSGEQNNDKVSKDETGKNSCLDNDSKQTDSRHTNHTNNNEFHTKSRTTKAGNGIKSIVEKGKELLEKVSESRNKDKGERKRLVQYSDDSSDEQDDDNKGDSRILDDTSRDNGDKIRVNTSSSRERNTRDSKERKGVVDVLVSSSQKSSNYGRPVERWNGDKEESYTLKQSDNERKKRRHDSWDEEYDKGKVKRTKSNRDKHHNHSYRGNNYFQREYDRKRNMRNDGWHSSQSNGRYKRSHDFHSRRDRRR